MLKGVMAETAGGLPILYPLPPICVFGGSEVPDEKLTFPRVPCRTGRANEM